jgi:hypothetical protein
MMRLTGVSADSSTWEKKEDESAKEEEQRLERFLKAEEDQASGGLRQPIFFACGGLVEDGQSSARSILDIATRLADKTRQQIVLFIRDEDGPAKRLPSEESMGDMRTLPDSDDGDGVVDVHPAWAELIYAPGAIPESLCVVSRLSYASILPKCSCAIIDGGHAITGTLLSLSVSPVVLSQEMRSS